MKTTNTKYETKRNAMDNENRLKIIRNRLRFEEQQQQLHGIFISYIPA